jgi:hypothetical protein
LEAPLFNLHADASITGGRGALLFDSFDQVVWAYDTTAEITAHIQAQAERELLDFQRSFQIVDSGATMHSVPVADD